MNIREINQIIEGLLCPMNEMAIINKTIEVNNEDVVNDKGEVEEKVPHFHWVYKRKIHFKFSNRCPKNITELKRMFAFKNEIKSISDVELGKVIKDLKSIVTKDPYKGMVTFEAAKQHWIDIHPTRNINKELVYLD